MRLSFARVASAAALAAAVAVAAAGWTGAAAAPLEAPRFYSPPELAGDARVGATLTASNGGLRCLPACHTYTWRFVRCAAGGGEPCAFVTDPRSTDPAGYPPEARQYVVRAADAGYTLRVDLAATNNDCSANLQDCRDSTTVGRSAPLGPIAAAATPPPPAGPRPPNPQACVAVHANAFHPAVLRSRLFARYQAANPGEWRTIAHYAADRSSAPPRAAVRTEFGRALLAAWEMRAWCEGVHD